MEYKSALAALALFAGTMNQSYAGLEAGIGVEHFDWKEFDRGGSQLLKEFGPRLTLNLNLTQDKKDDNGLLFAYRGKLYGGKATYNGATFGGTPVVADAKYMGMSHEGQAIYRYDFLQGKLDYLIGLGWDSWRRALRNNTLNLDQIEDYNIYYMRLGFNYDQPGNPGFHGGAGTKFTPYTTENAHLNDIGYNPNETINPGKSFSFYAELGYRLNNTKWDLVGYYDSYNFSASDPITTQDSLGNNVRLYQPKSEMRLLGIKTMYSF